MAAGVDPRVVHPRAGDDRRLSPAAWPSVVRLVLLDVCVGTPLAFGIGILEKADVPALGPPVLLAVLVFTLYADYAIVIDEVGPGSRSARACTSSPAAPAPRSPSRPRG